MIQRTLLDHQPSLSGRLAQPAPTPDESSLIVLAKKHLKHIMCFKCSERSLINDGKTPAGKHRVWCKTCRMSCNTSTYTQVLQALEDNENLSEQHLSASSHSELESDSEEIIQQRLAIQSRNRPLLNTTQSPRHLQYNENNDQADYSDADTQMSRQYPPNAVTPRPHDDVQKNLSRREISKDDKMTQFIEVLCQHTEQTKAWMRTVETKMTNSEAQVNKLVKALDELKRQYEEVATIVEDWATEKLETKPTEQKRITGPTHQKPTSFAEAVKYGAPEAPWQTATNTRKQTYFAPKPSPKPMPSNRYGALHEIPDHDNNAYANYSQAPRERQSNSSKIKVLTREELEFFKTGGSNSPMTFLYFSGCARGPIHRIKSIMYTAGIHLQAIRYIKFIGKQIMEVITFEDSAQDIIRKMATVGITHEANFDPLATDNVKNPKLLEENQTEEAKLALAKKLFTQRLTKMAESLPENPRFNRLRNFLNSRTRPRTQNETNNEAYKEQNPENIKMTDLTETPFPQEESKGTRPNRDTDSSDEDMTCIVRHNIVGSTKSQKLEITTSQERPTSKQQ